MAQQQPQVLLPMITGQDVLQQLQWIIQASQAQQENIQNPMFICAPTVAGEQGVVCNDPIYSQAVVQVHTFTAPKPV